ncbi:MAG: hypothetical protein OEN01_15960 [Candidatus Krumholzibacteria bacterium]|nr:hypothetical protein [Candidatus Krumholzibacteria bacterium]
MLRQVIVLSLVALLAASVGFAGDKAEKAWFDMDNCAMCKNMTSNAELMENMTWENHNISNGIVAVTNVHEKYLDAYRAAHEGMTQTGAKLKKGEMLELCGSCMAIGACMMKGPKQEYVKTSTGDIWIVTSDKPELVAELQSWSKRNTAEMAKMKAKKG